jgi:uncharacterized membrane protein
MLRLFKHLFSPAWLMHRRFPVAVLSDIQRAITTTEREHGGELRFVVEHALEPLQIWYGLTARERALQVFGQLRVWDTEANNGILVYVLIAERAVEIVADRGIARRVPQPQWDQLCAQLQACFAQQRFREGALLAVEASATLLRQHYPVAGARSNELPDQPVLL